jgi:hypothetical protein
MVSKMKLLETVDRVNISLRLIFRLALALPETIARLKRHPHKLMHPSSEQGKDARALPHRGKFGSEEAWRKRNTIRKYCNSQVFFASRKPVNGACGMPALEVP